MEGQRLEGAKVFPAGTVEAVEISTLLKGKKVVLIGVPGAFTPTCSNVHVPGYEECYDVFTKVAGVSEIYCVAVNDPFVMHSWAQSMGIEKVKMLGDGNMELSSKLKLVRDFRGLGFGDRNKRFSMFIDDGVVKKVFEEPEKAGDPFEVSDAKTMLSHISPKTPYPRRIALLTKPGCSFCTKAKDMLHKKGLQYRDIPLTDGLRMVAISAITGRTSTPQVFIDGKHIGGSDDLEAYLAKN